MVNIKSTTKEPMLVNLHHTTTKEPMLVNLHHTTIY